MASKTTQGGASAPSTLPFIDPETMPDLYAAPGVGTCMEPVFMDGTLLVFDKREQPKSGDVVVIWFTRDAARRYRAPGWVKRLIIGPPPRGFDGLIIAEQLNPPRQYSIDTRDVLAVHKNVGMGKSSGTGRALYDPTQGDR